MFLKPTYINTSVQIKDGDLVLLDMGCELHGYVSDLTRTWPPCGKFSSLQVFIYQETHSSSSFLIEDQNIDDTCVLQEELYDLILETNKESIKLCKPGTTIRQLNTYSVININLSYCAGEFIHYLQFCQNVK